MIFSFQQRAKLHDELAVPLVTRQFAALGYETVLTGIEASEEVRKAVHRKTDTVSMRFRYQPDRLFFHPSKKSVACEVKSEFNQNPSFAVEFDSYAQTLKLRELHIVIYAFVDITGSEDNPIVKCFYCFSGEIPVPRIVLVPDRFDHLESIERIEKEHPYLKCRIVKHKSGSGTPFFLIPKISGYLRELDDLIFSIETIPEEDITHPLKPEQLSLFTYNPWSKYE